MPDGFVPVFKPAGTGHRAGAVPDPGASTPATYVLRADATWGPMGVHPVPPVDGNTTAQNACNIAGYLAVDVIRESINQAVAAVNDNRGMMFFGMGIIALIPPLSWVDAAAGGLYLLYYAISSGTLADYSDALADSTLFARVTCAIYSAIEADGQVTAANFATVLSNLAAVSYTHSDVVSTIHDYVQALGYSGVAAIQQPGSLAVYDCTNCGSTGASGPTGLGPVLGGVRIEHNGGSSVPATVLNFADGTNTTVAVGGPTAGTVTIEVNSSATGATGPPGPTGAVGPNAYIASTHLQYGHNTAVAVHSYTTLMTLNIPGSAMPLWSPIQLRASQTFQATGGDASVSVTVFYGVTQVGLASAFIPAGDYLTVVVPDNVLTFGGAVTATVQAVATVSGVVALGSANSDDSGAESSFIAWAVGSVGGTGSTGPTGATGPTGSANPGLYSAYLCYQDQKAQNTNGGTFTAGSWVTRTLNTTVADTAGIGSLSGNQITLPAGTYLIRASAPAETVSKHQTRILDVTHTTVLVVGTSEFVTASGDQTRSECVGRFTLSGSTAIALQHQCSSTSNANGLGQASNFGTEVYAIVELWK